jgi:two-component system response regulator AtoC
MDDEKSRVKPVVLAVDDEEAVLESYRVLLEEHYRLLTASSASRALELLAAENVDLVLLDIMMPGMDGIQMLDRMRRLGSDAEVIVLTADKTTQTAVRAMRLGAYDYLTKPFDVDALGVLMGKALEQRRLRLELQRFKSGVRPTTFEDIIGSSEPMQQLFSLIAQLAGTDTTVLITGESGTGKELVARAIHFNGTRRSGPFVAVDCAAIPEDLLESELFGHEKGAFTDATAQRLGKFEMAHGGTLMLDEIGNMARAMQAKLLRALETREIQRVGGTRLIPVDVRIIAATNMDLRSAIQRGDFREDLYYRLNVVNIHVPPLRERRGDIPELIRHFMTLFNARFGKKVQDISPETMRVLQAYDWPGNVRELRNIIERMVALAKTNRLEHDMLPLDILFSDAVDARGTLAPDVPAAHGDSLRTARERFEREFILKVLERVRFNVTRAARMLGVHRNTLMAKMESYGLGKDSRG